MPVGFFTEGIAYELPHPPINERVVLLVCSVFEEAWKLLKQYPPVDFGIQTAHENTITGILVEIMEGRLRISGEVEGFNSILFGKVVVAPEVANYNKEHPNKKPDILFSLKRENLSIRSEQDGLFVECKPVDTDHPVYSCYCKKGLVRFVNGDYAWAMQQALMIGYARKSYSYAKLAAELDRENGKIPLNTTSHDSVAGGKLYKSTHARKFKWLEQRGQACPIEVFHHWLHL